MNKTVYILQDLNTGLWYVSSVLKAFEPITGKHVNTLRSWLKQPNNALKKGFILMPGEYLKSKQGGARI